MGKYETLWEYVCKDGRERFKLTFAQIEEIAGIPLDHAFLRYKKEIVPYGYQVGKISMKEQTVEFRKSTENIEIRPIPQEDFAPALDLAWQVFSAYDASDCTESGIEEFYKSIHDPQYSAQLSMLGAFQGETLVGILATRSEGAHIALFFVLGAYQRQGIGKRLFHDAMAQCKGAVTVNASSYAVPVYRKLGFRETDCEQEVNGIRFTPMLYKGNTI